MPSAAPSAAAYEDELWEAGAIGRGPAEDFMEGEVLRVVDGEVEGGWEVG